MQPLQEIETIVRACWPHVFVMRTVEGSRPKVIAKSWCMGLALHFSQDTGGAVYADLYDLFTPIISFRIWRARGLPTLLSVIEDKWPDFRGQNQPASGGDVCQDMSLSTFPRCKDTRSLRS